VVKSVKSGSASSNTKLLRLPAFLSYVSYSKGQ